MNAVAQLSKVPALLPSLPADLHDLVQDSRSFPAMTYVCSPAQRQALAELLPVYEASLAPATPDQFEEAYARLVSVFEWGGQSTDAAMLRIESYAEALAEIPGDVLIEAVKACVRECRHFPPPSQILERCGEFKRRRAFVTRARMLMATHDRDYRAPISDDDKVSPEECQRILAEAAQARSVNA